MRRLLNLEYGAITLGRTLLDFDCEASVGLRSYLDEVEEDTGLRIADVTLGHLVSNICQRCRAAGLVALASRTRRQNFPGPRNGCPSRAAYSNSRGTG